MTTEPKPPTCGDCERLRVFESEVRSALERKSLRDVRSALRKLDVEASIAKLRTGFADFEEAYLDKLTDEVGKREEIIRELHGQLSRLCSAIETHPMEQENDFVKQERERARRLLEHYDVSEMAKPPLRHWDDCTGRCCKGKP
jgi:hypothetical protein